MRYPAGLRNCYIGNVGRQLKSSGRVRNPLLGNLYRHPVSMDVSLARRLRNSMTTFGENQAPGTDPGLRLPDPPDYAAWPSTPGPAPTTPYDPPGPPPPPVAFVPGGSPEPGRPRPWLMPVVAALIGALVGGGVGAAAASGGGGGTKIIRQVVQPNSSVIARPA